MKKYILFSIIVLAALWILSAHQTKAAATLRVSSNGHYIEKSDGTPFLYLGDLDWVINMKYSDAEIDALLTDRQTNGFTVIAAAPAPNWGSINDDRKDYYDNSPFINDDITQFNAVYWDRWRGIADKCANRGLYLALTYGGPGVGSYPPWYADTDYKRYEYGRKIGDTFKDKTNVIFINSEDKDGDGGVGVNGWRTMAEGVADGVNGVNNYDGSANYSTTFMSFHPEGSSGTPNTSSAWFHTDTWLDANGIQQWPWVGDHYDIVNADYNKTNPVKPVICLEGTFEAFDYSPYGGWYISPHDVRVDAWQTYFAGGAGYTYAHGYSFQQGYSVYDYINSPGTQHMKVLKDFMASREWWKFVPDQGIIAAGEGSGTTRKAAVKSTDGDECYVYYPIIASANIKMNCITTSGNVDATWFDPRNGNTQSAGTYTTSQTVSLTPPSGWEDAVLYLKAGSAQPYCDDTICNGTETCSTCPQDCLQAGQVCCSGTVYTGNCCSNSDCALPNTCINHVCSQPSTNPIAWWKLDETSGTTASDSSGSNNTGTLVNGPVWTTGKLSGALSLNGTNNYVDLGTFLSNISPLTISAWVNVSSLGVDQQIISKGYDGFNTQWEFKTTSASGQVSFQTYNSGLVRGVQSVSGLSVNTWTLITGIYDGSTWQIYWNGTLNNSQTDLGPVATNKKLLVGAVDINGTPGQFWHGLIDDVRIYNRALSAAEVQALYNAGTDTTPPAAPSGVMVN